MEQMCSVAADKIVVLVVLVVLTLGHFSMFHQILALFFSRSYVIVLER